MDRPNKATAWKSLDAHAQSIRVRLPQYFDSNLTPPNGQQFNVSACNIHLDYSKQHITAETMELLFALAKSCHLEDKIKALFRGDLVNTSENRPALHTALRAEGNAPILVNHQNVMPDVLATRDQMQTIVEKIRSQQWLGYSGKPVTDIVNIGIGGSDLGPRFCINALEAFTSKDLRYHFISDADPTRFNQTVQSLNPETTLFIVSSKSFTTKETLYNAKKAMHWIGDSDRYGSHFIAVTAQIEKAHQFGIKTVLAIWDWVGGRYSFCSAINLIGAIAIGFESFLQLLAGARHMDTHFLNTDFRSNVPAILALLGIWNNNFLHIHQLLMLAYSQHLEHFVPYVQQLDMESNGKSIDHEGKTVHYATGPLVWGGLGNQAQHSYYQLLCQGTHPITADFISLSAYDDDLINELCETYINVLTTGVPVKDNPYDYIPGHIPLNHLHLTQYSPFTIGALVALYEHKIFTQSVIWNINPFDQPGIESAKRHFKEVKVEAVA